MHSTGAAHLVKLGFSPLTQPVSLAPLLPAEPPVRSSTALWAYLVPFAQDLPRPSLHAPEQRVLDHAQPGVAAVLGTRGETLGSGKGLALPAEGRAPGRARGRGARRTGVAL